jgi:hypothetical protein
MNTLYHAFLRFPNVTIANSRIVSSVTFSVYISYIDNIETLIPTLIYFNNVDNATAPTSYAEWAALAVGSSIAWNIMSPVSARWITSPDLSTILQPVINRPGWAAGNALQIKWESTDDATYMRFDSFDSGDNFPKLNISVPK